MAFGGTVKLTGESEYKKALSEITSNLKVLNSQMKVVTSEYDKNDKSVSNLSQQSEVLNGKVDEQQKKISILQKALEDAKKETGENSETSKKWQIQLNNAYADLNKLNKEVEENARELREAEKITDEMADETQKVATQSGLATIALKLFGKEMEDLGDETEETGEEEEETAEKTLKLGDIIKANLISDAIVGGVKALANGVKEVGSAMTECITAGAEYADTFLTMSVQTGMSTEELQKYNAVAELVDVSTETLTGSMAKNIKSMTSASTGTGAMAEAYAKLGVKVADADGKLRDSDTVYWETIDALKNVSDETERDAIAMQILGKSAQDLNPLIAQGSEGIKAMGDEAVKMGAVLSEDALSALGAVDDEMQKFSSITGATSNIFASAFAPAVSQAMSEVNDIASSFNGLITAVISGDPEAVDGAITAVLEQAWDIIYGLEEMVTPILELVQSLLGTIIEVLLAMAPDLLEQGSILLGNLMSGIVSAIPELMGVVLMVVETLLTVILENLPMIIEMGMQMLMSLVKGIADMLPTLIPTIVDAVILIVETLIDNIDLIIDAGISLILGLADGLLVALPKLIDKIPVIIDKLVYAIVDNLPLILQVGVDLLLELSKGILKALPDLVKKVPQIVTSVVNGIKDCLPQLKTVGKNLIEGLWNGIKNAKDWLLGMVKDLGKAVVDSVKSIFGIHSPSTVFRDEIGTNLALGLGEGFADTMSDVSADMQDSIPTEFDADVSTNLNAVAGYSHSSTYDMMVSAFKQALTEVKVVMNSREMGEFVTDTVERVVYS